MAQSVRVQRKLRGLNKLMAGREATAEVMRAAHGVKNRAGSKFEVIASPHKWTAGAVVRPKEGERMSDADRLALLRALQQ